MYCGTFNIRLLIAAAWFVGWAQSSFTQTTSVYTLDYQLINFGGDSSFSKDYTMEDSLTFGAPEDTVQSSDSDEIEIVSPLDRDPFAHNGVAIGLGTKVKLSWSLEGLPEDHQGVMIRRWEVSLNSRQRQFTRMTDDYLNTAPLSGTEWYDHHLDPYSVYYYQFFYVDAKGEIHPMDTSPQIVRTLREIQPDEFASHLVGALSLETDNDLWQYIDFNSDGRVGMADLMMLRLAFVVANSQQ